MGFSVSRNQNLITNLLLNGHFIKNIGLLHGKSGIAIIFYHLARQTGTKSFETFAGELIDEVIPELTIDFPVDFENGLIGIGWAIEYLCQNHYLDADTDEVLEDFDQKIFRNFLENTTSNIELHNGILGFGYYFLMRIKGSLKNNRNGLLIETNRIALQQISDKLCSIFNPVKICMEPFTFSPSDTDNDNFIKTSLNKTPVFDIFWSLPLLLNYFTELKNLNLSSLKYMHCLQSVLVQLNSINYLPVLESNKLVLLFSLSKLKHRFGKEEDSNSSEIYELTQNIEKNVRVIYNPDRHLTELKGLNLFMKNGMAGIMLFCKLFNRFQPNDPNANNVLSFMESSYKAAFMEDFVFDHSRSGDVFEKELGIFEGIGGLLLPQFIE